MDVHIINSLIKIKSKYINIETKYKPYIHTYFNDANEEIKRNYIKENEKVSKIKIIIESKVKSLSRLFEECSSIQKIIEKILKI